MGYPLCLRVKDSGGNTPIPLATPLSLFGGFMEENQIKKEINEYIKKIEFDYFGNIISPDILFALHHKIKVFLLKNCVRFGLSEEKIFSNSDDAITVLYNKEKRMVEIDLNMEDLKEDR